MSLAFAGSDPKKNKLVKPLARQIGIDSHNPPKCSKEKESTSLVDKVKKVKKKKRNDAVSDETYLLVINFYLRSDITRVLHTEKDVIE